MKFWLQVSVLLLLLFACVYIGIQIGESKVKPCPEVTLSDQQKAFYKREIDNLSLEKSALEDSLKNRKIVYQTKTKIIYRDISQGRVDTIVIKEGFASADSVIQTQDSIIHVSDLQIQSYDSLFNDFVFKMANDHSQIENQKIYLSIKQEKIDNKNKTILILSGVAGILTGALILK